jgi:dienelactone hydrolase
MKKWLRAVGLAGAVLAGSAPAFAQSFFLYDRAVPAYPDLTFPAEAKELGTFSSMSNGIFKPAGDGPFPAVVLVHTCGGPQAHMTERAKELLAAGFVVLALDSYGPRRHTDFCQPRGVLAPRVYKDSFDALRHLQQVKGVDPSRIYLVGLSLGSFAASSVASASVANRVGGGQRFRASVGWYGACTFDVSPFPKWELVHPDTDRPLLLLMSAKDTETPIADCFPRLPQMQADKKPVHWHVYDEATHGWDKSDPRRGYVLDRAVTADAMARTIRFLQEN